MRNLNHLSSNSKSIFILVIFLFISLIHGLIYVFLVPPWMHYDEPNHFEYVWLIANRPGLPSPGDYDPHLSHQVVESMIENRFFEYTNIIPPDISQLDIRIPFHPQIGDTPLYYILASIPIRILSNKSIEIQLYSARIVSLFFFLCTILVAWGILRDIVPRDNPLHWMVLASLSLIPSFVDVMTGVNNDTLAVFLYSLFLWGSIRYINKASFVTGLCVIGVSILCFFSRNTIYIVIPLSALVLLLGIIPTKYKKFFWGVSFIALLMALLFLVDFDDASAWYHKAYQSESFRQASTDAPHGDYIFHLNTSSNEEAYQIFLVDQGQIPPDTQFTFGMWMWSTTPVTINSPTVYIRSTKQQYSQEVSIDQTPRFYCFQFNPQGDLYRSLIQIKPYRPELNSSIDIFYDGFVLAVGDYSQDLPPEFSNSSATTGFWGDREFINIVRNGSAERNRLGFRYWVDQLGMKTYSSYDIERVSLTFFSILDLPTTGRYYKQNLAQLFRTFWAKFGWGAVPLFGGIPYRYLLIFSLLAIGGAVIGYLRIRKTINFDILVIFLTSILIIWALTITRGSFYIFLPKDFYPVARYAYPSIIPFLMVLNLGWLEIYHYSKKLIKLPDWFFPCLYASLFMYLDFRAITSLIIYYYN